MDLHSVDWGCAQPAGDGEQTDALHFAECRGDFDGCRADVGAFDGSGRRAPRLHGVEHFRYCYRYEQLTYLARGEPMLDACDASELVCPCCALLRRGLELDVPTEVLVDNDTKVTSVRGGLDGSALDGERGALLTATRVCKTDVGELRELELRVVVT